MMVTWKLFDRKKAKSPGQVSGEMWRLGTFANIPSIWAFLEAERARADPLLHAQLPGLFKGNNFGNVTGVRNWIWSAGGVSWSERELAGITAPRGIRAVCRVGKY